MTNKKTASLEEAKKKAAGLYQQAKEVIKSSYGDFKEGPSGLLVPADTPVNFQTKPKAKDKGLSLSDVVKATKDLSDAAAAKIAAEMNAAILNGPITGKHFDQIIMDDLQQVPKHIAADPEITPINKKVKPLDYKKIAAMLKAGEYTQDTTGAAHFKDGTVLSNQMLESPTFIQMLKNATVQLAVEQKQKEKQEKFGGQPAPPPKDQLTESEKEIVKALGLTEAEYLKWVNTDPDATVGQLLKTAAEKKTGVSSLLTGVPMPAHAPATLDAVEKAVKFGQMYAMSPKKMAEVIAEEEKLIPKTVDQVAQLRVLRSIVAAILLSPRSLKVDDGMFIVPKDTLKDIEGNLRLKVEFDPQTKNYLVTLE